MLQIPRVRCAALSDCFTNTLSSVLIIIFFVELSRFCSAGAAQAAAHTHSDAEGAEPDNRCRRLKPIFRFEYNQTRVLWQLASSV